MSDNAVQKVRESSTVGVDAGEISLADIEGAEVLLNQALLTAIASLTARGCSVAKLKLTLKAVQTD